MVFQKINITTCIGPIKIYRDKEFGIPNIISNNITGAMFGLGWSHAEDRLWQLMFLKFASQGRLSEIFGPKLIKFDKYYKTIGLKRISEENLKYISK